MRKVEGGTLTVPDVGIMGKSRHGKDTVAAYLVRRFNYERIGLADAMKRDLASLLMPSEEYLVAGGAGMVAWMDERKSVPEVLDLLKRYGSAQMALYGEDYWIDRVLDASGVRPLVIPDVRSPREYAYLKGGSFKLLRVVRPGFDNGLTDEQKAHWTETALDEYPADFTIVNDGDVAQLERVVEQLVYEFF